MTAPAHQELTPEIAQQLLREELAKPQYADAAPGWLERLTRWFSTRLDLSADGTINWVTILSAVLVIGVIVAIIVLLIRAPWRRKVRHQTTDVFDLEAPTLSLADIRQKVSQAQASGDHSGQVIWGFRAIAYLTAGSADHHALDGLTALEVARKGAQDGLAPAADYQFAAEVFTRTLYGGHRSTAEDARRVQSVLDIVTAARPTEASTTNEAGLTA